MPTFDELKSKPHVKNHPMFRAREARLSRNRELRKIFAAGNKAPVDTDDIFSQIRSSGLYEESRRLPVLIRRAEECLNDITTQFNFPLYPKVDYNGIKNVKYASSSEDDVVSGTIVLNMKFRTLTGTQKLATVDVAVHNGELIPPSVFHLEGREYLFAQSSIDDIIKANTSYYLPELRGQFDPPLTREERADAVAWRNELGWQPRENSGTFANTRSAQSEEDLWVCDVFSGAGEESLLYSKEGTLEEIYNEIIDGNFERYQHVYPKGSTKGVAVFRPYDFEEVDFDQFVELVTSKKYAKKAQWVGGWNNEGNILEKRDVLSGYIEAGLADLVPTEWEDNRAPEGYSFSKSDLLPEAVEEIKAALKYFYRHASYYIQVALDLGIDSRKIGYDLWISRNNPGGADGIGFLDGSYGRAGLDLQDIADEMGLDGWITEDTYIDVANPRFAKKAQWGWTNTETRELFDEISRVPEMTELAAFTETSEELAENLASWLGDVSDTVDWLQIAQMLKNEMPGMAARKRSGRVEPNGTVYVAYWESYPGQDEGEGDKAFWLDIPGEDEPRWLGSKLEQIGDGLYTLTQTSDSIQSGDQFEITFTEDMKRYAIWDEELQGDGYVPVSKELGTAVIVLDGAWPVQLSGPPIPGMHRYKEARKKKAIYPIKVPSSYAMVKEELEKAQEDGTDTFPRTWRYLLEKYILKYVSCADKDHWELHLINDGFAINVYDTNRGRRNAQEMLEDEEYELVEPDPRYYNGTKTPIEPGDHARYNHKEGPIRGTVIEIDPENDYIIMKAKGIEYRVVVDDIEPLPKTFKKMTH